MLESVKEWDSETWNRDIPAHALDIVLIGPDEQEVARTLETQERRMCPGYREVNLPSKGPVMSLKTLRVCWSAARQTILSRANFQSLYLTSSTI